MLEILTAIGTVVGIVVGIFTIIDISEKRAERKRGSAPPQRTFTKTRQSQVETQSTVRQFSLLKRLLWTLIIGSWGSGITYLITMNYSTSVITGSVAAACAFIIYLTTSKKGIEEARGYSAIDVLFRPIGFGLVAGLMASYITPLTK